MSPEHTTKTKWKETLTDGSLQEYLKQITKKKTFDFNILLYRYLGQTSGHLRLLYNFYKAQEKIMNENVTFFQREKIQPASWLPDSWKAICKF